MPTADANGISIAYEVQGHPAHDAIVLIAGLGLQLISWPDSFCRRLVEHGFRLVRFDNRDSGLSTKMNHLGKPDLAAAFFKSMFHMPLFPQYTLDDMALDTIGLMDRLGIERAHVAGASMGGMIAQIIATRHPGRVRTLTSIMSTTGRPGLPGPTPAAKSALFSKPSNPRDMGSLVDHFTRTLEVIGSPKFPTPATALRSQVMKSMQRNICPQGTARQLMAVTASGDRSMALRSVRAPTLVIHGSADPLVPAACGRDTARWIPGAVLHEIEGMGHDIPPALELQLADLIAAHCRQRT